MTHHEPTDIPDMSARASSTSLGKLVASPYLGYNALDVKLMTFKSTSLLKKNNDVLPSSSCLGWHSHISI